MESDRGEVTQLLRQWRAGDAEVESRLFELLTPDLHKIAERCFRREPAGNTLQPTALVNEAFIRLAKSKAIDWQDRGHFLAISARIMRRFLIERAESALTFCFFRWMEFRKRFLVHALLLRW